MTSTVPEQITRLDVTFKIARFIPESDEEPHYEEYQLSCLPTDRVLTVLQRIKDEIDGTLTFRRSCAHGICGSDAMRINGRNRLACKTLIKDLNVKKPVIVLATSSTMYEGAAAWPANMIAAPMQTSSSTRRCPRLSASRPTKAAAMALATAFPA